MGKVMLSKTIKQCALCKHWNGAMGSTTIKPYPSGFFQVESTENQMCYERCRQTKANYTCSKFEPRY